MAVVLLTTTLFAQNSTPPPSIAAGVFPVDQVRRGLHGVAYTVFEGTQPEAMNVELLGVLRNAVGPGQDMILARLSGTKPEYTGVVAGMSGSPVYIDGKLLGALAFRIGEFSKEPICGITPIQNMFQVRDQPQPASAPPLAVASLGSSSIPAPATPVADSTVIHPIETPLVFSGFGQEAIKLWQEKVGGSGFSAVAGIGGSASDKPQPEPIVPGSAVSAVLVRGDLEISATCTATYVDPQQLLACGHPITQFGPISMPMTKAEVIATLPSPLNAFKIVNTTETVGSFNEDRQSAIRGQFGAPARMIPVTVQVHGVGQPRSLHFEVIDQQQITPGAIMVSVFQSLLASNNSTAETSYHVRGTLKLDGYNPVLLDTTLAPTDALPASLSTALIIGDRFSRLYDNATRTKGIRDVKLEIEAFPGRRSLQLEGAHTATPRVHAGQTVMVEATVRPYHGEARNLRIPVKLPETLPNGQVRLLLSDGATLDRIVLPPRNAGKQLDLGATIAQLNSLHTSDQLYVTLLSPATQATLQGRILPSLPLSMANVLEPLRANQELALNGESAIPLTAIPMDAALTGQEVVTFTVE